MVEKIVRLHIKTRRVNHKVPKFIKKGIYNSCKQSQKSTKSYAISEIIVQPHEIYKTYSDQNQIETLGS